MLIGNHEAMIQGPMTGTKEVNMTTLGFPTIGTVYKFVVDALGIKFDKKSFLSIYYDKSNIDVGNLKRKINSLTEIDRSQFPDTDELIEQTFSPLINAVLDLCDFDALIKPIFQPKIKNELMRPFYIIFETYKSIVLNYPGDKHIILQTYVQKLALLHVYFMQNTSFKVLKSSQDILNWFSDDIIIGDYFGPVFDWWIKVTNKNSLRDLALTISPDSDSMYKQFRRWTQSKNLPSLENILEIVQKLPDTAIEPEHKNFKALLLLKLIISRFFTYIKNQIIPSLFPQDKDLCKYFFTETKTISAQYKKDKLLSYLIETPINPNHQETIPTYLEQAYAKLKSEIYAELSMGRAAIYNFMKQGSREAAEDHYTNALHKSIYNIGFETKEVLEEILAVASFLNSSKLLKKAYSWAYLYKLFTEPYEDIKNWAIWFFKHNFFSFFAPQYFEGVSQIKILEHHEDYKKLNIYNLEKFKVNRWKNEAVLLKSNELNLLDNYFYLSFTQLMRFCISGSSDKVKEALENGARGDISNEDNATALYYSLLFGHYEIAEILMNSGKDIKINSVTNKDKHSYFDALLEGLFKNKTGKAIEVLNIFIEKGMKINEPTSTARRTPIYNTIVYITTKPQTHRQAEFTDKLSKRDYQAITESKTLTGNDSTVSYINDLNELNPETMIKENLDLKPYLNGVIDHLLKQPDINCDIISGSGRTPLLYLSAEPGELDLFIRVLKRTQKKCYVKQADNFDAYESIIKNCIKVENWEILKYYLANIDINELISKDYYIPYLVVRLFYLYRLNQNNKVIEEILHFFGTYFLFVMGPIISKSDLSEMANNPDIFSNFMKPLTKDHHFDLMNSDEFSKILKMIAESSNIEVI